MSALFTEGFDVGYKDAIERCKRERGLPPRMAPSEYYWSYCFKFDLRDATRGEQEAVRVCFLAQRLELSAFTRTHDAIVTLVLGHETEATRMVARGEVAYDEVAAQRREP